jgi:hypothetical protein
MALDAKMIPSMQVDFSVSSQEATAEGTEGKYKESGTFMVGGRQWKLHCYPIGMNCNILGFACFCLLMKMWHFQKKT